MAEKQEKAIERCNELVKESHSCWIGISNQVAIETVLNMLKEKDKEIEEKDKIIDLTLTEIAMRSGVAKSEWKQYFERKCLDE